MNDTMSLAIVEKKPQRPGGCVGIFFRLFDWNQRFSKKNMFSKKFLPQVRFKQASKKFGGDEKQPKLRLIADENNGGFPNAKISNRANSIDDQQKHEILVPGIVARLMGLESMPTLQRDKSKKKVPAYGVCGKAEVKKELKAEKSGSIKHEVRPQKLQKTSISERQPITRVVGAEKLPFKNVLSKSGKHHPKLPSPVKSPKNFARKRPSKLIGAATRILEPGLQTNRSKCALTYSNTVRNSPKEAKVEDSCGFVSVAVEGESSCRNCGYLLDGLNGECTIGSKPLVFASPFSNHVKPSSCKQVNAPCYHELDDYMERHLCSQQLKPPKGMPLLPLGANQKSYRQNQMLTVRETVPPRLNATNLMNHKASISMNRNQSLSYSTRSRLPSRMENGRFELEKRINTSMYDSVTPGRKRRPNYISRQGENSGCLSTTIKKPVVGSPRSVSRKQLGHDAHYYHHECDRVGLLHGPGNSNVVSFTFNSSVKQKNGIHEVSDTRVRTGLYCDEGGEPALGESGRKTFQKPPPISGDALGALLEQKLKELGQRDNADNAPRKTTAMILEELITALTSDVPLQQDNLPPTSDRKSGWSDQSRLSIPKPSTVSQVTSTRGNAIGVKPSFDRLIDSEHLSPGSVLEPFFSTESCPSSSADDSLGCKTVDENLDCSYSDILDCAASLNAVENTKDMIGDIIKNVSEILRCSGVAFGLKENELYQVKKVLLNAELAFHSSMLSSSAVGRGSPIKHLLLDELDMLASVLWMNFGCSLGIEDGKEVNQLKRFVLDSVMEYLGIRFKENPEKGFGKFPIRMSNSMLIVEIVEVVRRWGKKSRLDVDELIEREMDESLKEWTRCENEGFEWGIEMSRYLLQILVDEMVMDLCC